MDRPDDGRDDDEKVVQFLLYVGGKEDERRPFRSVPYVEPERPELGGDMREGLWGLSAESTDIVMAVVAVVVLALTLAWLTWIMGGAF